MTVAYHTSAVHTTHSPARVRFACLAFGLAVLMGGAGTQAQLLRPPSAEVTSLLAADGVQAGTGVRAAIRGEGPGLLA